MLTEMSEVLKELQQKGLITNQVETKAHDNVTINACYQLTDEKGIYFLKLFSHHEHLPVDRQSIFDLQTNLAELGIAPLPLYLGEKRDFQLEVFTSTPQSRR